MTAIYLALFLLQFSGFSNCENLRGSTTTFVERRLEEQFNIFKSYKNSANKPPQYSLKKWSKHGIQEYLSPQQRMMYATRYGKDTPDVMFNRKWSGFDKQKRALGTEDDDDAAGVDDDASGNDGGSGGNGYSYYYSYDNSGYAYNGDDQYYYGYESYGGATDDDGTEGYVSDTIYLPNRHLRKLSTSNLQSKIDSQYQMNDNFGVNFKEISMTIYDNFLGFSVVGLLLVVVIMMAIIKRFKNGEDKKIISIE